MQPQTCSPDAGLEFGEEIDALHLRHVQPVRRHRAGGGRTPNLPAGDWGFESASTGLFTTSYSSTIPGFLRKRITLWKDVAGIPPRSTEFQGQNVRCYECVTQRSGSAIQRIITQLSSFTQLLPIVHRYK
eukprot:1961074-Rhodomonas_salina.1